MPERRGATPKRLLRQFHESLRNFYLFPGERLVERLPGRLTASAFSAGGSLGQQSVEQLLRSAAYQLANGAPERLIRERFFGDLLGDPIDRDADGTDHRLPYALIYDALEQAGSGHETSVPRGVRGFTMVRLTLDRNTGDTPVL